MSEAPYMAEATLLMARGALVCALILLALIVLLKQASH